MIEKYASLSFYRQKIIDAANGLATGDLSGIGTAIFGFYSGKDYQPGQVAEVSGYHIKVLFVDNEFSKWCKLNPELILRWVEASFFYFRSMSAIPEVAREVWQISVDITRAFLFCEFESFCASFQLASWDYFYGKEHHPGYLDEIKSRAISGGKAKAHRALFLSTYINQESDDFFEYVKYSYKQRGYFSHANLVIAVQTYYCKVSKDSRHLDELLRILMGPSMRNDISHGNADFLKPLLWEFYDKSEYGLMMDFLRTLKKKTNTSKITTAHAFLLSNGERLSIMTSAWKDEFSNPDSYDTYKKLIQVSNVSTNTAISLLGEAGILSNDFDPVRRGAPPIGNDLSALAEATVAHFKLDNPVYSEVNLMTLVPSHNFPIQSSLFRQGKVAPIISVSLEDILDDSEDRKFVFFLSSHTSSVNTERDFIYEEFGGDAEVWIDPSPELFMQVMNFSDYNYIYISAHGEYDHWGEGGTDEIIFSDHSRISVDILRQCAHRKEMKRNVILNICDGATSPISCIPYQRGLASSLASGAQTIISHLWPVSTIYACAFGLLNLHFLRSKSAIVSAQQTYTVLSQEHEEILSALDGLSPSFSVLKGYLGASDFKISEFKNIGSVAVYS